MKKLWLHIGALVILAVFTFPAVGQTADCPPDKVCLTQEQAAKYLTIEDTLRAVEKENLVLRQALLDQKEVTVDVKIELARVMGEKTGAEQAVVRLTADNQFLLKNGRKKCAPFAICF